MQTLEEYEAGTVAARADALELQMWEAIVTAISPGITREDFIEDKLFAGVDQRVVYEAVIGLMATLLRCYTRRSGEEYLSEDLMDAILTRFFGMELRAPETKH